MGRGAFFVGLATVIFACGGRTLDDIDSPDSASDTGPVGISDGGTIPAKDGGGVIGIDSSLPPGPVDGGPIAVDAMPPPTPIDGGVSGQIPCGASSCNASTQTCCVTFSGQLNETCTAPGQCAGASIDCASAANCPSKEVCCAHFSQANAGANCAPSCKGGFQNPQLCATSAECQTPGMTCKSSAFGYQVCRF